MTTKQKFKRTIIIALIIAFIILSINVLQIPEIIECERLTKKYSHEFDEPWKYWQYYDFTQEISTLKVLEYSPTEAAVFYITKGKNITGGESADIIVYERTADNSWKVKYEHHLWGGGGNLCENAMPYWWYNFPAWVLD